MLINIELDKLNSLSISLSQYLVLLFLSKRDVVGLMEYNKQFNYITRQDIDNLILQGFIVDIQDEKQRYLLINLQMTDKFSIFAEPKIDDWIDEWYNLFPQGIKSGNYYVKSDKQGCRKKLERFLLKYPEYNKDIILVATQNYVNELESKGFKYMQTAHYFIEKNGMSALAGYCEAVSNGFQQTSDSNFINEI